MIDTDRLLERTATARLVLIGEATHGTSEFFAQRAELTKRLIHEQGFGFVAVADDEADGDHLHEYVTGNTNDDPATMLDKFDRWPNWRWANEEMLEFAAWLRAFNHTSAREVGFHGLDRHAWWASVDEAVRHVREEHPEHTTAALEALRHRDTGRLAPDGCTAPGPQSWDARERHMIDTLDDLLRAYGNDAKGVVWAHNTQAGDARATDMGVVSMGQLARERYGAHGVVLVGFGTYWGTTIASQVWGGPVRRIPIPPARPGSLEHLLHHDEPRDRLLLSEDWPDTPLDHRTVDVVYRPATDAHTYAPSVMSRCYDAFLFHDQTSAVGYLGACR